MIHSRILVTGATGYIGGQLLPRLLDAGYAVRVLVSDASREVQVGDAVDFMRVEAVQRGRMLRPRYEGKMLGCLWLQFEVQQEADGRTLLVPTLFVETKGFLGLLYWYLTYPAHAVIFSSLLRRVSQEAEECAAALEESPGTQAIGAQVR